MPSCAEVRKLHPERPARHTQPGYCKCGHARDYHASGYRYCFYWLCEGRETQSGDCRCRKYRDG